MKAPVLVVVAMCLLVTHALGAPYKPSGKPASGGLTKVASSDGTLLLEARTIEGNDTKLVATGRAHLRQHDAAARTTLDAEADKIVVITGARSARGGTSIRSANLTGPVKMVYTVVGANGVTTKTTATADSADFDGPTSVARLVGNVKITNENPSIFAEPAVMAGDKATVNLAPNLGPDQFRFRVESTSGLSTITATPKAKEQ